MTHRLQRLLNAAEETCRAIEQMQDGLIAVNSKLGRIMHSYHDLKDATRAFRDADSWLTSEGEVKE